MVLINLHRNLHEKSSFLSEIMFIRINPYLCHLLTRYQSTIFPNHKSCVRKKGVPCGRMFSYVLEYPSERRVSISRLPPVCITDSAIPLPDGHVVFRVHRYLSACARLVAPPAPRCISLRLSAGPSWRPLGVRCRQSRGGWRRRPARRYSCTQSSPEYWPGACRPCASR